MDGGGGLVVIMHSFYSKDPSSNPVEIEQSFYFLFVNYFIQFWKMLFEKDEKEAGLSNI